MEDSKIKEISGKVQTSDLVLDDILAEFSDNPAIPSAQQNTEESTADSEKNNEQIPGSNESVSPAQNIKTASVKSTNPLNEEVDQVSKKDIKESKSSSKSVQSERSSSLSEEKSESHSRNSKTKKREKTAESSSGKSTNPWNHKDSLIYIIFLVLGAIILLAVIFACILNNEPASETPIQTSSAEIAPTPTEIPAATPAANTTDALFLKDLEKSITNILASDEANLREAVHANLESDLELLSPYVEAEFEDETLGTIAQNYIAALNKETDSFDAVYEESDLLWYEGYVLQMQMLSRLSTSYGFMYDNSFFQEKFISPLTETSTFYNKYSIISKDIRGQIDGITYLDYVNDYRYKTTLKNRTNYTFDITFYFDNYNEQLSEDEEEAALIEPASSAEDVLTNITPLKNYVVTDRVTSGVAKMKTFVCHWTITSID